MNTISRKRKSANEKTKLLVKYCTIERVMYLLRCITHRASLAKKRVSVLETKINTLKLKFLNYFRKKYEYFKPGS